MKSRKEKQHEFIQPVQDMCRRHKAKIEYTYERKNDDKRAWIAHVEVKIHDKTFACASNICFSNTYAQQCAAKKMFFTLCEYLKTIQTKSSKKAAKHDNIKVIKIQTQDMPLEIEKESLAHVALDLKSLPEEVRTPNTYQKYRIDTHVKTITFCDFAHTFMFQSIPMRMLNIAFVTIEQYNEHKKQLCSWELWNGSYERHFELGHRKILHTIHVNSETLYYAMLYYHTQAAIDYYRNKKIPEVQIYMQYGYDLQIAKYLQSYYQHHHLEITMHTSSKA